MKLLKQLCDLAGIPGREERVSAFISEALKGHVDELNIDALGNLIVLKKSKQANAKRIMIVAHMDEIGFYVKHIDDKGFLRIHNVGGFDTRQLLAKQVIVSNSSQEDFEGVIAASIKPVHISTAADKAAAIKISELFVDLGRSAEEVKKHIRVGDMVTLKPSFQDMNHHVSSKALDDRSGCWVLINALKQLNNSNYDVYGVFSVQEEVGVRGATTSAYGVEPDIGIALDVTLACDVPGTKEEDYVTKLGGGTAIKILDGYSISNRWLVDEFINLAESKKIKHQLEVLPAGGTDAAPIQLSRAGVASITLSIPCRYIHSSSEMVSQEDLNATLALLSAYLAT